MPPPSNTNEQFPFWDFVDPSRAPGSGIDHYNSSYAWPFASAWGPPHPPGPPGANPPPPPPPPPHHRHNHHHHRHQNRHHRRGRGGGPGGFGPWWYFEDDAEQPSENEKDQPMADADAGPSSNKNNNNEKEKSPDTLQGDDHDDAPDPAEVTPDEDDMEPPRHWATGGCRGPRGCRRGGRGGAAWHGRGGGAPAWHGRGPSNGGADFNFQDMLRRFSSHPFLRHMGDAASRYRDGAQPAGNDSSEVFSPPADVFNTADAYVVHVALPGAKKEDVGVSWDPETSVLRVSGVVHRPGDEEFLKTLHAGERRVGEFAREVELPPAGVAERGDVDGEGITAKLEDGVLVVTVRKVEKEWTEVRKVDIL